MKNIAKQVNDYLLSLSDCPVDVIYNDVIPVASGDTLMCRHDPSTAVERRYADGSRRGVQSFGYYARCANPADCRDWLQWIIDNLDGEEIAVNERVTIECEAVTLPQFVETAEDQSTTIYTASINVTFNEDA